MQAYLVSGKAAPPPSSSSSLSSIDALWFERRGGRGLLCNRRRASSLFTTRSTTNSSQEQDHYSVLGLSSNASSADIKRAFRFLALKYHPDVSKEFRAGDVFKSIHLAYEVLSNKTTRTEYDKKRVRRIQEERRRSTRRNWDSPEQINPYERVHVYTRSEQRRRRKQRQWFSQVELDYSSSSDEDEEETSASSQERGSFVEVLRFTFFTLLIVQTLGVKVALSLSGVNAMLDRRLDSGYKLGYVIAWFMGGRGGVLLAICLSFASWLCGKCSSSFVALVVVAMWVGVDLARFAPLPRGAILTLLYMSIRLQDDLKAEGI
ncbi:hypothetical protein AMTRI_Chr03g140380 [Amborella trichopoda]|uniref:J domain-containing protein n=1 Tax=Amborella trichopoda TaxID=13333 RepID=U5DDS8_AMBTC|nr:dnaJ homolog subfamily C member 18 [Amborella trichopoda]ERN20385.1 hypothetical protein AMTR_s00068p00049920 [Amborella trichopoda]|eukprot:XP_006858918.1 dnaJ homolog subfamily C member 18 [Amborella trichopoda]